MSSVGLSKDYFLNLSRRIYLSPTDDIIDRCLDFVEDIKKDLDILKTLDTENLPIFYNLPDISISFATPQPSEEVENKEILKSLVSSYELPNIHDSK